MLKILMNAFVESLGSKALAAILYASSHIQLSSHSQKYQTDDLSACFRMQLSVRCSHRTVTGYDCWIKDECTSSE